MRSGARASSEAIARLVLVLLLGVGASCAAEDPASTAASGTEQVAVGRAAQRVRVATVRQGRLTHGSTVSGLTQPFRQATVAAEVGARVIERHVEPGQTVAQGDPLVSLDPIELAIAVEEATATRAAREVDFAQASRELGRGDELFRKGAISDGQHDALRFGRDRAKSARDLASAALRRARKRHSDAVVRAPFGGTVERVHVQVGDYANPGTPVAELVDFEQVRLRAGVTAGEAAGLSVGSVATLAIPALGGAEATAVVHSVGLMADAGTGTYPVELWLDNPERSMRAGMVAELRLPSPEGVAVAVAPRQAILRRDGRLSVYVVEQEDGALLARLRPVRVGREQGDEIELREGVAPGEHVVVDGLFALSDGSRVQVDGGGAAGNGTAWND